MQEYSLFLSSTILVYPRQIRQHPHFCLEMQTGFKHVLYVVSIQP